MKPIDLVYDFLIKKLVNGVVFDGVKHDRLAIIHINFPGTPFVLARIRFKNSDAEVQSRTYTNTVDFADPNSLQSILDYLEIITNDYNDYSKKQHSLCQTLTYEVYGGSMPTFSLFKLYRT